MGKFITLHYALIAMKLGFKLKIIRIVTVTQSQSQILPFFFVFVSLLGNIFFYLTILLLTLNKCLLTNNESVPVVNEVGFLDNSRDKIYDFYV